jgi:hypothetical protein
MGRMLDHRPKSKSGEYLCWDFASVRGCEHTPCKHKHESLKYAGLDWSQQFALIRRGGPKGSKMLTSAEATAKIAKLRADNQATIAGHV